LGWSTKAQCPHITWETPQPRTEACEECGSDYELRVCAECGHVGCSESELGHDTDHFRETGHAVIQSLPLNEDSFTWCYTCESYL